MNTPAQNWLSIGKAAKFLGISRDTLRRWEKRGKIKAFRSPTNRRYYTEDQLKKAMQEKNSQFITAVKQVDNIQQNKISIAPKPSPPEKKLLKLALITAGSLLATTVIACIILFFFF